MKVNFGKKEILIKDIIEIYDWEIDIKLNKKHEREKSIRKIS